MRRTVPTHIASKTIAIVVLAVAIDCARAETVRPVQYHGIVAHQRADAERTGFFSVPAIRRQPHVKWASDMTPMVLGTPLVVDEVLYTGGSDGTLYAIDAESGKTLWTKSGFEAIESAVAVSGDVLVACGQSKLVRALDRRNGNQLWSYETSGMVFAPPAVVHDLVYIATYDRLAALDLATGHPKWTAATGSRMSVVSAPAVRNGMAFVSVGPTLFAFDAATGVERWRVPSSTDFWGLAVGPKLLYVGNSDGRLHAYDPKTGQERWTFKSKWPGTDDIWSAPSVATNRVYVGSRDRFVYALDAMTGERIWEFETAGDAVGDPVIADGFVYVTDSNHLLPPGSRRLHALDAGTGAEVWRFERPSTFLLTPALGKSAIYITMANQVLALEP